MDHVVEDTELYWTFQDAWINKPGAEEIAQMISKRMNLCKMRQVARGWRYGGKWRPAYQYQMLTHVQWTPIPSGQSIRSLSTHPKSIPQPSPTYVHHARPHLPLHTQVYSTELEA